MADLKVDLSELALLQARLDAALAQLESDVDNAAGLESAVGDPVLVGAVHGFNIAWNKHRFDIRDNLTWLRDSIGKIGDSFTDADTELASALEQNAPAPSAAPSVTQNGSIPA